MPVKQIALSYSGTLYALTEDGRIWERVRDDKHFGPAPRLLWSAVEGPAEPAKDHPSP